MKKTYLFLASILSFMLAAASVPLWGQNAKDIGNLFSRLDWRNIGPAEMGGRTVDIDVVESQPWIIYAAMGPSGVWRSVNNGITWKPVFQKENTVSVGDVTICQSNPDIIWVGSGEPTCRNSVTIGDGVYKSEDAGKTWTNMGLKETRHISRILIDPTNPDIVYVAAMGHLWGSNPERGIFKTTDGGKTWNKILFVNENTGFADLAMHAADSKILYAASYEYRRYPYYFSSGGPGSAIYKSIDAGKTWKKLAKDLPEGTMGRIGLAVSRSRPDVVYALIEHKDGGIWRSEDKGDTWTRTCDNKTFIQVNFRPFYYSQIRVDPSDDKTVYVFSGATYVSGDMGGKFRAISAGIHPDHHALWIDPHNPAHLIDGNDGGIDITYDKGRTWKPVRNIAAAEVYHVGFDMRDPYFVYCGLQDNGVWGGPSSTYDSQGITNEDWFSVGSGDGFYAQVDPTDPNTIYWNYQMNVLSRFDMRMMLSKMIRPLASLEERPFRYNWNSPILISPHDSKTVYTGGQFLFKTTDRGLTWEKISPDLTTDNPDKEKDSGGPITPDNTGAEIHCTLISIAESPVKPGIIWCGTDDGNLQLTQDGGKSWTNTVSRIPDLLPNTWCSHVEASHFSPGTAYASFDGHRTDDYAPHLYKTADFGRTWTSISANLPFGWIHVIREDPRNRNLLYAGMEFGIFASLDGGKSWFSLKNNLPTVAVRDIAVHPRENDLIIGTHGRGIWIMDDIRPLQETTPEVLANEAHFFSLRPATRFFPSTKYEMFSRADFAGRNPKYGAAVTAYFQTRPPEIPKIIIRDSEGKKVSELRMKKKAGLQRVYWGLQFAPRTKEGKVIKTTGLGLVSPPYILSGRYSLELQGGSWNTVRTLQVKPDPRVAVNPKAHSLQADAVLETMILQKLNGRAVTAVSQIRRSLGKLKKTLKESKNTKDAFAAADRFEKKFLPLEKEIKPKGINYRVSTETALRGGSYTTQMLFLGMSLGGFPFQPTKVDWQQIKELKEIIQNLVDRLNVFIEEEIPRLNTALKAAGLKPVRAPKHVALS